MTEPVVTTTSLAQEQAWCIGAWSDPCCGFLRTQRRRRSVAREREHPLDRSRQRGRYLGYGLAPAGAVPHELNEHDRASLEAVAELAAEKGLETKTRLATGNAGDEIVSYADEIDADLIVVGSRGHGAIARVARERVPWSAARGPAARPGRPRLTCSRQSYRQLGNGGRLRAARRRCSFLQEAFSKRITHELGPARKTELLHDVGAVSLRCADRDIELLRDLLIRVT